MSSSEHELSTLDKAHAHRLAGEDADALRLGIACAQAAPSAPGPAALLTRMLVDADRSMLAPEVVPRLVDSFIRRGDLPSALVAAQIATDAGDDAGPHFQSIATAFGAGSSRVGEGAAPPPPFPNAPSLPPMLARLDLDGLFGQADRVLNEYMSSNDDISADAVLPELPLFGSLDASVLAQLLDAIRVDEVSGHTDVVRQGDPGNEAFVVARGLLQVVRREGADDSVLAQLGPGAVFGEMALVSAAPRTASVVALEPAQILVLARDELERLAPSAPSLGEQLARFCRSRMEANLIRHARVLQGVPMGRRSELLSMFGSAFFEAGEPILKQGGEGERVYLIASGSVSVSMPDGVDRLALATLGPGEVVGEISLILRSPVTADVTAIAPTVAFELTGDRLRAIMRDFPSLLVELYDLATRREDETTAIQQGEEAVDADDLILV